MIPKDIMEHIKMVASEAEKAGIEVKFAQLGPNSKVEDLTDVIKGMIRQMKEEIKKPSDQEAEEFPDLGPEERRERIETLLKENYCLLKKRKVLDQEFKAVIMAILDTYQSSGGPLTKRIEDINARIIWEALQIRDNVVSPYGRVFFKPAWGKAPDEVQIEIPKFLLDSSDEKEKQEGA